MAKSSYREKPQDIHAQNLALLKERTKQEDKSGVYIFYGDEEYTKNHYTSLLLKEAGSNLNVTSFYGDDFTLEAFISACETSAVESFDMFSLDTEQQTDDDGSLRVIKLYNPDLSSMSKKDSEYFIEFLSALPEKTIVIFWFYMGDEDVIFKNTLYKKITEFALTVNFKREAIGSSALLTWILRHFSKEKLNVDRHVALHLCQTVGNSMTDLKNEIDKLIDYLHFENRDTLVTEDIDFICIKSYEAQIFDISDGVLSGNFVKAAKALGVLRDKHDKNLSPVNIAATLSKAVYDLSRIEDRINRGVAPSSIASEFKMHEFVVKKNITVITNRSRDFRGKESFTETASKLCLEYDRKIKSSRTDGYELLMELIFKLSFAGKNIS